MTETLLETHGADQLASVEDHALESVPESPGSDVHSGIVPTNVRDFITECVRSPDGLYVLQRIASTPLQGWSLSDLALDLSIAESRVEDALQPLFDARLLVGNRNGASIRYRPATIALEDLVNRALLSYRENALEILKLLMARAFTRLGDEVTWLAEKYLERRGQAAPKDGGEAP